jgi:hypothetical protein
VRDEGVPLRRGDWRVGRDHERRVWRRDGESSETAGEAGKATIAGEVRKATVRAGEVTGEPRRDDR